MVDQFLKQNKVVNFDKKKKIDDSSSSSSKYKHKQKSDDEYSEDIKTLN